ncbi:MAG: hypothetical protein KIT22_03020 [Verrucomicrobiae bacterium]|nr:hypothetical protein [Verrucomicrobiae bacterium]
MNILERFFSPRPPSAGSRHRAERARLKRAISAADTDEERLAHAAQLHLTDAGRAAEVADKFAEYHQRQDPGSVRAKAAVSAAAKARDALSAARAGVARLLGLSPAPTPAAVASPAPTQAAPAPTVAPFQTLPDRPTAGDLGAFMLSLLQVDKGALAGRSGAADCTEAYRKMEVLGEIVNGIRAVDPSGKILEALDAANATERDHAVRTLTPIIRRALAAPGASGASASPNTPKTAAPRNYTQECLAARAGR